MQYKKYVIIFTLLLVSFAFLVYAVANDLTLDCDLSIINTVQGWSTDLLTSIMKAITGIGSWRQVVIILAFFVIYLLYKKHYNFVLFIVLVNALSPILNSVLKEWFQRSRPNVNPYHLYDSYSFPSGHATSSIVLFATLTFVVYHLSKKHLKGMIIFSTIMVLLIGFSRFYLGVHYPSDIIGGYLVGLMWLVIAIFLFNHFPKFIQRLKRAK